MLGEKDINKWTQITCKIIIRIILTDSTSSPEMFRPYVILIICSISLSGNAFRWTPGTGRPAEASGSAAAPAHTEAEIPHTLPEPASSEGNDPVHDGHAETLNVIRADSLDHRANEPVFGGEDLSLHDGGYSDMYDSEPELDHPHFINTHTELFINNYYPGQEHLTEQDR
ncbi:hypothetical protein PGT21_002581 [Puccinia graminis f. sp. tritici]|uniref:Uncharacterized protein n=1 Tax=Puccinia graminis f. sp. tritici TaxID=56615 RepID=A0A5B0LWE7_PUCGR|nr:hypothetical protein PGT21_002581 [Puccinia graminis f. sp. tritici]